MTREATPENLIAELDRVADALEGLTMPGEAISCAVKRLAEAARGPLLIRRALAALQQPAPRAALLFPDRRRAEEALEQAVKICGDLPDRVKLRLELRDGAKLFFLHSGPHLQAEVQGMEFRHVGIADGCDEADAIYLRSRVRA